LKSLKYGVPVGLGKHQQVAVRAIPAVGAEPTLLVLFVGPLEGGLGEGADDAAVRLEPGDDLLGVALRQDRA
jgi:hypothetical protein